MGKCLFLQNSGFGCVIDERMK